MSEELEALKRIETTFSMNKQGKGSVYRGYTNSIYPYYEDFDLVLNALKRLEVIDNANPSEALDKLKTLGHICVYRDTWTPFEIHFEEEFTTIKKALLKAQEHEKVLEIIENKNVDIFRFRKLDFTTFNQLQRSCNLPELTQEEFDLLKEVIGYE